jgi:hypothetical protein
MFSALFRFVECTNPDTVEKISVLYSQSFFCNDLARLFKLPTTLPVLHLCKAMLEAECAADECEEAMAKLPDWAVEAFDSACLACRALRALACPRPFVGSSKAAADMFAPQEGVQQSKGIVDLANSVRSSTLWLPILDEYWGASGNDERLAEAFTTASDELESALDDDDGVLGAAVSAMEKVVHMQDFR